MTTIVAQPFNVIKWQLKFNPVALGLRRAWQLQSAIFFWVTWHRRGPVTKLRIQLMRSGPCG